MLGPPVSPERHWNTWDSAHPASLVHLPSRLALRLAAFSGSEGRYSDFPTARLLEHTPDASYVAAEVELAGTRVRLELAKADPFTLGGRLTVLETGEWALRFWLLLELGYPGDDEQDPSTVPTRVRLDPPEDPYTQPVLVRARHRSRRACLLPSERPTYAGLYDDLDELREELEEGGYYRPHPEQPDGRWAVLRFNGQSQASTRFALAEATDDAAAERRARELLPEVEALVDARAAEARRGSEPARAVRDVVAWNTTFDDANQRWFTLLTRNWTQSKFGGWGVWLDDVLFHALLAACAGDAQTARANLEVALTGQQPEGNLACLLTAYTEWVDRSQPPIGAYVALRVFLLTGDRALLEQAYPTLRRAHDWWFEHRDGNGDGVLEHGSSPTGEGTFVHTKQGAMDEAAMDNLPLFDDAVFDERAHTLDLEEVGLNSLVVLDGQMLSRIARLLGRAEAASAGGARRRAGRARARAAVGSRARGVRGAPLVRRVRRVARADELLSAGGGDRHAGAGRGARAQAPARPRALLGPAPAALDGLRRPGHARRRLLARAHLAAARVHDLGGPAPRRLRRRGGRARRARVDAVRGRVEGTPALPRELQDRPGRRPRGERLGRLLHVGRTAGADAAARGKRRRLLD